MRLSPPVMRLSAELLGDIFTIVFADAYDKLEALPLTHVCKRWRQVALGHRQLWRNISLDHPGLVEAFLSRASPLTLKLYSRDGENTMSRGIFSLVRQALSRTGILALSYTIHDGAVVEDTAATLFSLLQSPAPLMEDFSLDLIGCQTTTIIPIGDLFGGEAPRLQEIRIKGYPISRSFLHQMARAFSNLTALRLHRRGGNPVLYLDDILDCLGHLANLEWLSLSSDADGHMPRRVASSGAPYVVHLPQLRALKLSYSAQSVGDFLSHIDIPTSAFITLRLTGITIIETLISTFSALFVHFSRAELSYSKVCFSSPLHGTALDAVKYGVQVETSEGEFHMNLELEATDTNALQQFIQWTCTIFSSDEMDLHLDYVESSIMWSPEVWLSTLGAVRGIEGIVVPNGAGPAFCEAMSRWRPAHATASADGPWELFTSLSTSTAQFPIFFLPDLKRVTMFDEPTILPDAFHDYLMARQLSGSRLRLLALSVDGQAYVEWWSTLLRDLVDDLAIDPMD